jgi:hypothetical protein
MYTPIQGDIYALAFDGAMAGMLSANRVETNSTPATYDFYAKVSRAWAESFDTAWDNAASLDEVQAMITYGSSAGFWGNAERLPVIGQAGALVPSTYDPYVDGIIATITSAENDFANQGITPPPWGGGGGGSNVPDAPTAAGTYDLVVPSVGDPFWDIIGGDKILSFTGITATEDLGISLASVTFAASLNAVPISAHVSWSGVASGSQVVTPLGTSLSGTITGPFTSNTNAATLTVTLTCVFPDGTQVSSQTVTWAYRFLSLPAGDTSGAFAAFTASDLETILTSVQNHTGLSGSYPAALSGGNVFGVATPTALGAGSWTSGGFAVSPSFVKTIAGYTNPEGIVTSMDLYTFPVSGTYVLT